MFEERNFKVENNEFCWWNQNKIEKMMRVSLDNIEKT